MYTLPEAKHLRRLLAAGTSLALVVSLPACKTTGSSTASSGPRDEALYLFDDGTGDLPAVDNYAYNDSGEDLNFTAAEQVQPQAQQQPAASNRRGQQQVAQYTPPAQQSGQTMYAANMGPGGGGATSDVLTTPPQPVTQGSNYGAPYSGPADTYTEPAPKPATTAKKKTSTASTRTYVVKRGDTLSGIASRYGTSVTKIKNLNGLSGSTIQIGQKLKISGTGATATATSGKKSNRASSHTVRSGDNLWDLSRKYGVSVTALKNANNMSSSTLQVGKKLRIP